MSIKVEENLEKKQDSNTRGRGRGIDSKGGHKGGSSGRIHKNRGQGDSKLVEKAHEPNTRSGHGRGRSFPNGGRGRSSGLGGNSHFSSMKCYNCGKLGHLTYRFPDKPSYSQREKKDNICSRGRLS